MVSWNGNLDQTDENKIADLLIGRRIVNVENDLLQLDDGTVLRVIPNEGCGGCSSGWYYLRQLNQVSNAITSVEFTCEELPNEYFMSDDTAYRIYVYADGIAGKQTLLSVEGNDGSGYYGTGYEINVVMHGRRND